MFGKKMKEIYRDRDSVKVGQIKSILDSAGIQTFMRNEVLSMTEISIPDFFPAVCVVNDSEYGEAINLIREQFTTSMEDVDTELHCSHCGEKSPGSFGVCWHCNEPLE